MLNITVREEWNSFEDKCLHESSQQNIANFKLVFYAAYEAALLTVMALLKAGAPVETVLGLEEECAAFWRAQNLNDSDGGAPD